MIAKNKVLGSTGTHFMHMRVKLIYFSKCFDEKLMSRTQKKISYCLVLIQYLPYYINKPDQRSCIRVHTAF